MVVVPTPVAPVMAPAPEISIEPESNMNEAGAVPSMVMAEVRVPAVLVICKALARVPEAPFSSINNPLVVVSGVFLFWM